MPGQIAQLMVPADGGGNPTNVVPDWARGKIYFVGNAALRSYHVALVTQSPIVSSLAFNSFPIEGTDVDPVTGALLICRPPNATGESNGVPLYRFDPDTFAVTGSFGAATPFVSWPASFSTPESVVCVGCGTLASGGAVQVGYAFFKESVSSGNVGVVRTDTMQQGGFHTAVVSGSVNNRALMCRGASGGSGASVFLGWTITAGTAVTIATVAMTPGAETYDSASWPATNPHIASHTIGTIAAASIDPTWTSPIAITALGYDAIDGNVLMDVNTSATVTQKRYLVKVNATTAAVIWRAAVPPTLGIANGGLAVSDVSHGILAGVGQTGYLLVDAHTGVVTPNPLGGLTINPSGFFAGNQGGAGSLATDTASLYFVNAQFDGTQPNAPVPVAGTPSSFGNGYALIGGLIPPPSGGGGPGGGGGGARLALDNLTVTAQQTLLEKNLISLRWSDDRGHSWGSWVTQDIGEAGEYRTSLQWQRLAYARDRCFEISWSVPMRTALQGCWVDVTPAQS